MNFVFLKSTSKALTCVQHYILTCSCHDKTVPLTTMSILHSLHFSHETFFVLDTLCIVNDVLYIVNGCVNGILIYLFAQCCSNLETDHNKDGELRAVLQILCHEIPNWHYLSIVALSQRRKWSKFSETLSMTNMNKYRLYKK